MKDKTLQFRRYPYGAYSDPDLVCLQNKYWQLIKLDFTEWIENLTR